MAKISSIENNNRRRRLVDQKSEKRKSLKKTLSDHDLDFSERLDIVHKLAEMPRNSSKTRIRNRCLVTGRSRGFYRKFSMSRIALRELGSSGLIPGLTKSSW